MAGRIFSPGKLLLTSEYVVLDGALALALPTKWGQEFFYEEIEDGRSLISWTAMHKCVPWLQAEIDYRHGKVLSTNLPDSAAFILKVLLQIKETSGAQLQKDSSYSLTTNLQFPPDYGLGSSSTLMNNLAEWAETDPFVLNEICLGGSGYDIAVAKARKAVLYQNLGSERKTETLKYNPVFKNELIFIHLNQKQNSRDGIKLYREKTASSSFISEFSELTHQIVQAYNLQDFSDLMAFHEEKLSDFLGMETVKQKHFSDCPVFVKSLGAWGGDFVMSTKFPGYENYFWAKGFSTVFDWKGLIL
ncbi:GYDIA family GHMP kinase [Kaistella palustris]|uniref:GYDIA family GHMP kinase n=1 Tax=Kaistella palustris TaxID=493376 RepID=UPI00041B4970|nr:GYDIA family GHMP kinase [Kaistella palustris]